MRQQHQQQQDKQEKTALISVQYAACQPSGRHTVALECIAVDAQVTSSNLKDRIPVVLITTRAAGAPAPLCHKVVGLFHNDGEVRVLDLELVEAAREEPVHGLPVAAGRVTGEDAVLSCRQA
jgi:hypothetical protein